MTSQILFQSQASVEITDAGITAPTFPQLQQILTDLMKIIFGQDVVLDDSTMDGQLIGIIAQAIDQSNNAMVKVFSGFSPTNSQGSYLDALVAINGLTRKKASYSTVEVVLTGQPQTVITDGIVGDSNGNQWNLPSSVTIPESGEVIVTATAQTIGAIYSSPNSVTVIVTPFAGWTGVNNPNAANVGQSAESDSSLRQRQSISQELPSQTLAQGIVAGILSLQNVTYCKIFVNSTNETDGNGIPAHSISVVVGGGDVDAIATIISNKKSLGCGTYGNTSVTLPSSEVIQFQPQVFVWFRIVVNIAPTRQYNANVTTAIKNAIANYINNSNIGDSIWLSKIQAVANVPISSGGQTYKVESVTIGWSDSESGDPTQGTADAELLYYQSPQTKLEMIQVNLGTIIQ